MGLEIEYSDHLILEKIDNVVNELENINYDLSLIFRSIALNSTDEDYVTNKNSLVNFAVGIKDIILGIESYSLGLQMISDNMKVNYILVDILSIKE